jgi:hypothetical protein
MTDSSKYVPDNYHVATESQIDEVSSALTDLAVRFTGLTAHADTARSRIATADLRRRELISASAVGKHDGKSLSTVNAERSSAAAELEAINDGLTEIGVERERTEAYLAFCERLREARLKKERVVAAKAAAAKYDEIVAQANAQFYVFMDLAGDVHPASGGFAFAASAPWAAEIRNACAQYGSVNSRGSLLGQTNG